MSNTKTTSHGIGFFGMLTILFIGLKLTGYIQWSWLWVMSPMWLPITLTLSVVGIGITFYYLIKQLTK